MHLLTICDPNDAIAFRAFYVFITPALGRAARGQLAAAFHPDQRCTRLTAHSGPGPDMCGDCAAVVDDLVLDVFTVLRQAIVGDIRHTSTGEEVRELAMVAAHLSSAEAADEAVEVAGARLASLTLADPDAGPRWLRAAKAQLVHYPTRHLATTVRRRWAVEFGWSSRPDRDLSTAAWAAPLRASQAGLDLLVDLIRGLHARVPNPWRVHANIYERHCLTETQAVGLRQMMLDQLRQLRPSFYRANIEGPLACGSARGSTEPEQVADPDTNCCPEPHVLAAEAATQARQVLLGLVRGRPGEALVKAGRRRAYGLILMQMVGPMDRGRSDLVATCRRLLDLPDRRAVRLVRRLARLVAVAGIDWVEDVMLRAGQISDGGSDDNLGPQAHRLAPRTRRVSQRA